MRKNKTDVVWKGLLKVRLKGLLASGMASYLTAPETIGSVFPRAKALSFIDPNEESGFITCRPDGSFIKPTGRLRFSGLIFVIDKGMYLYCLQYYHNFHHKDPNCLHWKWKQNWFQPVCSMISYYLCDEVDIYCGIPSPHGIPLLWGYDFSLLLPPPKMAFPEGKHNEGKLALAWYLVGKPFYR